jgi:CheY-like chemotaxis protein/HPt (histidine-containing phosphotransfer) domain-containing protein
MRLDLDKENNSADSDRLRNPARKGEHGASKPMLPLRSQYKNDPDMQPLIQQFVAGLSASCAELSSALAAGDLESLRHIGHQLKGSGSGYGYPEVTAAGAAVEEAVRAASSVDFRVESAVEGLRTVCQRAQLGFAVSASEDASASDGHACHDPVLESISSHSTFSQFRILVIDDFEPVRREIAFALRGLFGVAVLEAANGRDGLTYIRQHKPTLVVLDLNLPDISGMEVLEHSKSDPETRDIPVIVLTAQETTEDVIPQVLLAGACDYLRKPIDANDLRQYISARIALAAQQRSASARDQQIYIVTADPLTTIIGFARLLEQDDTASRPSEVKQFAHQIAEAGERVAAVLKELTGPQQ